MVQEHETQRILALVNRGDWACAYDERAELARILRELAELLDESLADQVVQLADDILERGVRAATRDWVMLASTLRHRH